MRGGRAPVERPGDAELGVEVVGREPLSDRVERLRIADGRSAVLKLGGFWAVETERRLYELLLRPEVDGSPALIASGPGWVLIEDVAGEAASLDHADAAYRRLAALHAARSDAALDDDTRAALLAAPLSACDASAFIRAADELAELVERAAAERDAWEIGQPEREAADRLRAWADSGGSALAASGPVTLLHGDFQRGNWLRDAAGALRLVDWELAGLGPGVLDLYYLDLDGPGAGHAPAGDAARRALDAYGSSPQLVRDAAVWGGLTGARLRLADYYADVRRSRTPRDELPATAASLLRSAAERARRA